jgi:hypothetical protein
MLFPFQHPAPIRSARHLGLNLVRNNIATFPEFPSAAKGTVNRDQIESDGAA